jgi:hypothetical protein
MEAAIAAAFDEKTAAVVFSTDTVPRRNVMFVEVVSDVKYAFESAA